jgi:hypothetical protein
MEQIFFQISFFLNKRHRVSHLTKFHLETVASVSGRPPHLIISKVIPGPLKTLLPVRRAEFRPQELTPNFGLPVTHEICGEPYLTL